MKNYTEHYLVAAIVTTLIVFATYVYPFMLADANVEGNDIAWEQYIITFFLLLPAIVLIIKKPRKLWLYTYPLLLLLIMVLGIVQGDALGAGLLIIFIALPIAVVYSILVLTNVIK